MKKFLVFLGLFYALGLSAQYKYQIKANLLVRNGGITNGFNLGFETLHKKTNYLIDFQTFGEYPQETKRINKENQVYNLTEISEYNSYLGTNLGFITSLSESDKYSLSGGFKAFVGLHTRTTIQNQYTLDSGWGGYGWSSKSSTNLLDEVQIKQAFAFRAIPFIRMSSKLSPQFFLIPEIQLPITGNINASQRKVNFNLGFNISIAYHFIKTED